LLAALAYADDLVLCGTREEIKKYTEILDEWCEENHFKINVKKSAVMPVGFLGDTPSEEHEFFMNRQKITVVDKFKFLGITVTADGSMKEHARNVIRKARALTKSFYKEFTSDFIKIGTKLELMRSAVLSVGQFAEELYDEGVIKHLEAVQREITHLILGINSENDMVRNDVTFASLCLQIAARAQTTRVL